MEMKLKKIKNENYRFYYLNFQNVKEDFWLDKNTRIISFILDGQFEVATTHWYELYVKIFDFLQRIRPHTSDEILDAPSLVTTRVDLFIDHYQEDYYPTECGLYIKKFSNANKIVQVIKRLLQMYYVDLSDSYLVVEIPPRYEENSEEIIGGEKEKLRNYLCSEYVKGNEYYEKALLVIDEMNKLIQAFSSTAYNNLYLLNSLEDYRNYSHRILNNYIYFNKGVYSEREYRIVAEWLECARFFKGDIFRTVPTPIGESVIEAEDKTILVTMMTKNISGNSK